MKRIPVPKCVCCQSASAAWESELWPSVQLCYRCVYGLMTWFVENDLAHGNPFVIHLAENVWPKQEFQGQTYQTAWYRSPEKNSSSQILIRLPK